MTHRERRVSDLSSSNRHRRHPFGGPERSTFFFNHSGSRLELFLPFYQVSYPSNFLLEDIAVGAPSLESLGYTNRKTSDLSAVVLAYVSFHSYILRPSRDTAKCFFMFLFSTPNTDTISTDTGR